MPSRSLQRTIDLRDGSRVTLRPIRADDREILRRGFERLSDESRYRRFFTPMPKLTSTQLAYLTEVDHHDHEAIVAVDPAGGDLLGVARFVRSGDEPDAAEAALVVGDAWQGRGLGRALLERLADRAREEGVRYFTALAQADNARVLGLLRSFAAGTRVQQGRDVELRMKVPRRGLGPELRGALREAAAGGLVAGAVVYRLLTGLAHPSILRERPPLRWGTRIDTIVVGTDGSGDAAQAVAAALALAKRLEATLHVVSAYTRMPLAGRAGEPGAIPPRLQQLGGMLTAQPRAEAALEAAAAAGREDGIEPVTHLRRGDPADALIAIAEQEDADLIVVGGRGTSGSARFLLGSVPGKISHHAPCSVLIVRTGDG